MFKRRRHPCRLFCSVSALLILLAASASAAGEIARILDSYATIHTASCRIRRQIDGEGGSIRYLSRIYYSHDDRLHVENISPVKRRIVSDGTTLFSYAHGDPKGFSRKVSDLSNDMLVSLRKLPGTATEHLLRLKDLPEETLPPNEAFQRRIGFQTDTRYVVLGLDALNRPAGLDFYHDRDAKDPAASYRYSKFSEVAPGVSIPLEHRGSLFHPGNRTTTEIVRVDSFLANQPIAPALFNPDGFFPKDIAFVDRFTKIYE